MSFWYGPDQARYKQVRGDETTYYIGKDYEHIVASGGQAREKTYLGGYLIIENSAAGQPSKDCGGGGGCVTLPNTVKRTVIDGEVHYDFDFGTGAPPDDGKASLGTGSGLVSVRLAVDQIKALDGALIVATALSGVAGAAKAALGRLYQGIASRTSGLLGRIGGKVVKGVDKAHDVGKSAGSGRDGTRARGGGGARNNPEQSALINMAKKDKKTGITQGDAQAYKDLGKKAGVPVRGPEVHPKRSHGKKPHIHVGPVDHIPVKLEVP